MKSKPFVKPKAAVRTACIVACFQGEQPRYLRRDPARGHYVVTLDESRAMHVDEDAAAEALEVFERMHGWKKTGGWRVYRITTRTAYDALEPLAA